MQTIRVTFESDSGFRCCLAVPPNLPNRRLVLDGLPTGGANVTLAGFPFDFAPADGVTNRCATDPADVGQACDSRPAPPSFRSDPTRVDIAPALNEAGEVLVFGVPFLLNLSPAAGSNAASPITVRFTVADSDGVVEESIAVELGGDSIGLADAQACDDFDTGSPACSDARAFDIRGFAVVSQPQAAPAGSETVRIRAVNLDGRTLDFTYDVAVPTPSTQTPAPFTPTTTATPEPTDSSTPAPTDTPSPVDTATTLPTSSPSTTATPSPTLTPTPAQTDTATAIPSATPTLSPTPLPTLTSTQTPIDTPTETPTEEPTATLSPTSLPTLTSTPTPVDTPTETPTEEPTATAVPPTATPVSTSTPANLTLTIGSAVGSAGSVVPVAVTLSTAGTLVLGTQNQIALASIDTGIRFASRTNAMEEVIPDCQAGAGLLVAFGFRPQGCSPAADCNAVMTTTLSSGDPISDGATLYTCNLAISPAATAGTTVPILCSGARSVDAEEIVSPADCPAGSVVVLP